MGLPEFILVYFKHIYYIAHRQTNYNNNSLWIGLKARLIETPSNRIRNFNLHIYTRSTHNYLACPQSSQIFSRLQHIDFVLQILFIWFHFLVYTNLLGRL